MCVFGVPEGEDGVGVVAEKIFEGIMAELLQNLMKTISLQIQEDQ